MGIDFSKFAKDIQASGDEWSLFEELFGEDFSVSTFDDGQGFVLENYNAVVEGTNYTLFDLGVNENFLMRNVKHITGDLNLKGSALTEAPRLTWVDGNIYFHDNKISDLRSLEKIYGKKVTWIKP